VSHFRTVIYDDTKAAIVAANTTLGSRVTIERIEPFVDQRGNLASSDSLPLANLALGTSRMEREGKTGRWRGSIPLDVEIFADGTDGETAAQTRDAVCEEIKTALLSTGASWGSGQWTCAEVTETTTRVDGPMVLSMAKMTLALAIEESFEATPEEDFDGIDVTVQTTEPDDTTTEFTFSAEPNQE